MIRRQLILINTPRLGRELIHQLGADPDHVVRLPSDQAISLSRSTPRYIELTETELKTGDKYLAKYGLSSNSFFISFCVRDSSYLKSVHSKTENKHDFRDSDVDIHARAIERFNHEDGSLAFRLGAVVEKRLEKFSTVVDYSTNGDRSEFLDIFLSHSCGLFINSSSGLGAIPRVLRTPAVATNIIPLRFIGQSVVTFIPKLYWSIERKTLIPFKEILESDIGWAYHTDIFKAAGVEIIENSEDEIYHAVSEATSALRGNWQPTDKQAILVKRFTDLFHPGTRVAYTSAGEPIKLPDLVVPLSAYFAEKYEGLI